MIAGLRLSDEWYKRNYVGRIERGREGREGERERERERERNKEKVSDEIEFSIESAHFRERPKSPTLC